MTTMAGRILRRRVLERLAPLGVERVVIAGLANTYSDYITTREEYELQHYEGASTLFGPHTHAAYLQIFSGLADSMRDGAVFGGGERAPAAIDPGVSSRPGVVFDDKRLWEKFGQVMDRPGSAYSVGQEVSVTFRTSEG
jgi:neutral ceramidase